MLLLTICSFPLMMSFRYVCFYLYVFTLSSFFGGLMMRMMIIFVPRSTFAHQGGSKIFHEALRKIGRVASLNFHTATLFVSPFLKQTRQIHLLRCRFVWKLVLLKSLYLQLFLAYVITNVQHFLISCVFPSLSSMSSCIVHYTQYNVLIDLVFLF